MSAHTSTLLGRPLPHTVESIVIGASAGAIDALSSLLPLLPKSFSSSILIVVHIPADKDDFLVGLFRQKCQMTVREVEDKEPLEPGTIYFAPPDYHLLVESKVQLALSNDEPVHYSRPSIDVLFGSAAEIFGRSLVGIILSGGSTDGAQGLQTILEHGGTAIVQSPDGAYASAMPRAALERCPQAFAMELGEISKFLCGLGV